MIALQRRVNKGSCSRHSSMAEQTSMRTMFRFNDKHNMTERLLLVSVKHFCKVQEMWRKWRQDNAKRSIRGYGTLRTRLWNVTDLLIFFVWIGDLFDASCMPLIDILSSLEIRRRSMLLYWTIISSLKQRCVGVLLWTVRESGWARLIWRLFMRRWFRDYWI